MGKIDTTTDLEAFQSYINEYHGGTLNGHTLDEAISEFRRYQSQLKAVKEKIARSEHAAKEQGTQVLDDDKFWARANARMEAKDIPDK